MSNTPISEELIEYMKEVSGDKFAETIINNSKTIRSDIKKLMRLIEAKDNKARLLPIINSIEMAASAIGAMRIAEGCAKLRGDMSESNDTQCYFSGLELELEGDRLLSFSQEVAISSKESEVRAKMLIGVLHGSEIGDSLLKALQGTFHIVTLQDTPSSIGDCAAILNCNPSQGGIASSEHVRKLNDTIPILMITNNSDLSTMQEAIVAGASDFISKPIFLPTLIHRLKFMAETENSRREIYKLAHHDILTGLPNRALFNDRLATCCVKAKRNNSKFGVMFIDLDGFKAVNDTLGHEAGDELLKGAAERIGSCVRDSDTVARLGGDEFVIIVDDVDSSLPLEETVGIPANRIINYLKEPFTVTGKTANIGASIGIAIFPDHGDSPDLILSASDELMYQVKKNGKGRYLIHS